MFYNLIALARVTVPKFASDYYVGGVDDPKS
jgi:hypothetical protein